MPTTNRSAAALLHQVVEERERRREVEASMRRTSTPLALQEQASRMKEALQLEVLARQQAEAKAQRATRQHQALDAQLRIANETAARLQREQQQTQRQLQRQSGGGGGRASSSSARSPGTPTTAARLATISSVISGAASRIVDS